MSSNLSSLALNTPKEFNDGKEMPMIGLGTWRSDTGLVKEAVQVALRSGYRHIDCAWVYGNEQEVGEGLKASFDAGVVKREEVWVTSKLWNVFHRPELVEKQCKETLANLQLDYVDLFLIHWPTAFIPGEEHFPKDENDQFIGDDAVTHLETWKAMEGLVKKGLVKNIGLSNFNHKQIQNVLDHCEIKPSVLQIELHPWLPQQNLVAFCKKNGIQVTAYSPLGSPTRPWVKDQDPVLMEDDTVVHVAKAHNKTPAQVLIRYHLDQGNIVIPKSTTPARIEQNIDVFDFQLSKEELKELNQLKHTERVVPFLSAINHPQYGFHEKDQ